MISKSQNEVELMRIACKITGDCLKHIEKHIKAGISTLELDKIAKSYIIERGATPTFLNYEGYPNSICASVNNVVVHGIPSKKVILREGDIVSIDVGACYKGFNGDAARTFPVGNVADEVLKLVRVTEECFFEGIKNLKVGSRIGVISHAVEKHAKANGYGVVKELVGHGVGRDMHEDPEIPNYGAEESGEIVVENACLAIEPMITLGSEKVYLLGDDWGVITRDGLPASHYENTVLVTKNGVEILTL